MKRKFWIVLLALGLALSLGTAVGCGRGNGGGNGGGTASLKATLAGTKVSWSSAQSVGIVRKGPSTAKLAAGEETKKNYFVTFDSDNKIQEVVFLRDKGGRDEEITQEQIPGEIDKCYSAAEFTFLRFAVKGTDNSSRRSDKQFDRKDYLCDENYQSFVVHKASGKVYSLDGLETVGEVSDGAVKCGKFFYKLSLEGEALKLTTLVSNPNVTVKAVFQDRYGNTFVENDKLEEIAGTVCYFRSYQYGQPFCVLGSDGRAYEVTVGLDFTIRFYDANLRKQDYNDSKNVVLNLGRYSSNDDVVVNKDYLINTSFMDVKLFHRNGALYSQSYPSIDSDNAVVAGDHVFGFRDDTTQLCHYTVKTVTDEYETRYELVENEIMTANEAASMGDWLRVTVESAAETNYYRVAYENGRITKKLLQQISYEEEVLVLQPLN